MQQEMRKFTEKQLKEMNIQGSMTIPAGIWNIEMINNKVIKIEGAECNDTQ